MTLAERPPVVHTVQAALPVLAPGVSVALLKRVWNATPTNRKHLRGSILESIVCVVIGGLQHAKPLHELTLAEVEQAIGAVTPRFVVRWYQDGLKGVQATTFVVRADAETFAAGRRLYGRPSTVRELGK